MIFKMSSERLQICRSCEKNSLILKSQGKVLMRPDEHCTECGCTLAAKTKCASCECPLKKWGAYLTETESEEVKKAISGSNNS
jgi:hypothetical protein